MLGFLPTWTPTSASPTQPCARQERPCAPVAPAQYFAGAVERDSLPRGTAEVYDSLLAHLEVGFASVPTTPYHPNSGAPRATGWGSRTAPTAGYRPDPGLVSVA